MKRSIITLPLVLLAFLAGCGDGVGSEEDARRAYLGLDKSIDKTIQLGFDGFNAASSANIDPQSGKGDKSGTITVSGKVDQGSSDNKTMTLNVELAQYSDDGLITYDTPTGALPVIDLKLSKIPTGTMNGTMNGDYAMSGDLEGTVKLSLTLTAELQAGTTTTVERKPGTTHIVGTATSDYGTYDVDITR